MQASSWQMLVIQVGLALCPSEDRLCVVTSDSQLFDVKMISQHIKSDDMRPLVTLFHGPGRHSGGITGMDTCIRKTLVATCGMDRTIRLWNIVEQRMYLWKSFEEEPLSLAMHPTGLHLIVGFADKLRLINILLDDMRICHEVPIKQCKEVKFSNGGSMFAVVNGNVITIFDFNTYDKLTDLRGHNSKVMSDLLPVANQTVRARQVYFMCKICSRCWPIPLPVTIYLPALGKTRFLG